ncbi:hypothetical protein ALC53_08296 [Atta colombica]|uniref:Uncharacterized protein n=1 Tax=Atta colombica TaxID=520822 RepID=A0A195BAI0_9HYME|nr:hypothetical protein ALC53_08296 [Atta colombica]
MARYRYREIPASERSEHWMPDATGGYPAARIYGVCPKINTHAYTPEYVSEWISRRRYTDDSRSRDSIAKFYGCTLRKRRCRRPRACRQRGLVSLKFSRIVGAAEAVSRHYTATLSPSFGASCLERLHDRAVSSLQNSLSLFFFHTHTQSTHTHTLLLDARFLAFLSSFSSAYYECISRRNRQVATAFNPLRTALHHALPANSRPRSGWDVGCGIAGWSQPPRDGTRSAISVAMHESATSAG